MADEVRSTETLIALMKSGQYDGVVLMQAWCRLRQLEAENAALLKTIHDLREQIARLQDE